MEGFSKEKTEIKKPPTYLFYLLGVILLFLAGFGIYYFGYYQYLQKQLTNLTNQNLDINTNKTRVNINQTNLPNPQKILIDSPKEDEVIGNPVVINGQAEVFEAMFNIRIKNANGEILGETTATAKEGQTLSPYEVSLNYATSTTEFGLIEAFDYSAKDGSIQDLVSVKIKFASFGQPSQDETADLSSKALATEDWQTYRNEKYGFEISYPKSSNFNFVDYADIDSLKSNNISVTILSDIKNAKEGELFLYVSIGTMGIQYTVNVSKTNNKNIKDWFEANKEKILIVEDLPKAKISNIKETFLDNSESLKIEYSGNPVVDTGYYTIKNGYLYAVEYTGTASPYRQEHLNMFDRMLSTFKFTEKGETE